MFALILLIYKKTGIMREIGDTKKRCFVIRRLTRSNEVMNDCVLAIDGLAERTHQQYVTENKILNHDGVEKVDLLYSNCRF